MEKGAEKLPALAALKKSDEDAFKERAHTLRSDGAWIDAGENDNVIVQTLEKTPGAVGVFGYSFLENNMEQFALDAAAGQGETLVTVAGILNVDEASLAGKLQSNFGVLFASNDVDAVDLTLSVMQIAKA